MFGDPPSPTFDMSSSQANPSALLPDDDPTPPRGFVRIGRELREEALARLLATDGGHDLEHARRFLDYATENQVSLDHLWGVSNARQRFEAVVLAVPGAGRSAMMFVSKGRSPDERELASRLLAHAARELGSSGVHLAQALLDPHEDALRETFVEGGFHELATLSYLERPLRSRSLPGRPIWPADVTVHSAERVSNDELVAALDASYENTMDCPGLRGHRKTEDILAGHRASGLYDASLWTLLRMQGEPAGVLLLNPAADASSIELVYIGLATSARGRGLGVQLLRHGLHQVSSRKERVMTLAVDEANVPAQRLYARENFRPVLRRMAMIRPLHGSA